LHAYGDTPHVVETPGEKPNWSFKPLEFHSIAKDLDLLRTENLGNLTGPRSYYLIKELAQLEQALIHFTVDALEKKGFILYSVPDLLHSRLIESCGMDTKSERTQVKALYCTFKKYHNLNTSFFLQGLQIGAQVLWRHMLVRYGGDGFSFLFHRISSARF
jgi:hypothetical protein